MENGPKNETPHPFKPEEDFSAYVERTHTDPDTRVKQWTEELSKEAKGDTELRSQRKIGWLPSDSRVLESHGIDTDNIPDTASLKHLRDELLFSDRPYTEVQEILSTLDHYDPSAPSPEVQASDQNREAPSETAAEATEDAPPEKESTPSTAQRIKSGVSRASISAYMKLQSAAASIKERLTSHETDSKATKRMKRFGAVALAAAGAGIAVAIAKDTSVEGLFDSVSELSNQGYGENTQDILNSPAAESSPAPDESIASQEQSTTATSSSEATGNIPTAETITVERGDNVWNLSEKFLRDSGVEHPTLAQIHEVTQATLEANSLNPAGDIDPGQTIKITIPPGVL